jgi:hypothetical protein
MFDFTLEWTGLRSRAQQASEARTIIRWIEIREVVILPLLLLLAFLLCLGVVTTAHLRGTQDRATLSFAVSGMGFPIIAPLQDACRAPAGLSSAPRLRHTDLTALLTAK